MISATSFVYVIDGAFGPPKVGSSGSPSHRAVALKKPGQPVPPVYFEMQVKGEDRYGIERLAHHILSNHALGKERFDVEPEIAAQAVRDAALRYAGGERAPTRASIAKQAASSLPADPTVAWQRRAKAAGLTQVRLAKLLGRPVNTISRQIRGENGGVPQHLMAVIIAWEMLTPDQRDEWVRDTLRSAGEVR